MDQRDLVDRARGGDHDAFTDAHRPDHRAAGRGSPPHPPGPRARARRGPGRPHPRLAGPPGPARPGPVRRLAPSHHRERLPRPHATAPSTGGRGRARAHRRGRRPPTSRAAWPTATCSTRRFDAWIPVIGRSSSCTTTSACRSPTWPPRSASRSGRPAPGCITRSSRCGPPWSVQPTMTAAPVAGGNPA